MSHRHPELPGRKARSTALLGASERPAPRMGQDGPLLLSTVRCVSPLQGMGGLLPPSPDPMVSFSGHLEHGAQGSARVGV